MKKVACTLSLLLTACAPISDTQRFEQRLSELEIKVAKLEEKQEETNLKLEEINKRLDYITEDLGKLKLTRYSAPKEEKPILEEKPSLEDEVKVEYQQILELYNMKRLNEAKDAFVQFIKKHPATKYTDNAYFWLGKTYYELGNIERAKQIFDALIKKCQRGELPDCNKLPDTYFMLVKIAVDEGNITEANNYLATLEERFPNSEATSRARSLLYKTP